LHEPVCEKDKARDWIRKAEQWIKDGRKNDEETKRFRAEAVQLMGNENARLDQSRDFGP
jgi:hypothetical protein